jgi:multiple sugar transport system ATP-binding protein
LAELTFKNINKIYDGDVRAVTDLNLEINKGEFVVFVGRSGCGKTTTLRMIAGLEDITSGDLMIDGKRVNDVPPKDRDIAMVFQSYALYPHLSVYDNIAFSLSVRKVPKPKFAKKYWRQVKFWN